MLAPPSPAGSTARAQVHLTPSPYPLPERSTERSAKRSVKRSGSGSPPERSGSGSFSLADLPVIPGVQWERNARGGFEAWHCPPGAVHRRDKFYLGYFGKKIMAAAESPDQLHAIARQWVEDRRQVKGVAA